MSPNKTLATEKGSGGKKSKDRVTIALTVNASGSEKFEPWIIGKAKNPRCFKKHQYETPGSSLSIQQDKVDDWTNLSGVSIMAK